MNKAKKNNALEKIVNFYQIDKNIGTSGQPETEQFKDISTAGYEVVVNLSLSDSPNAIEDENNIISNLSMTYVHVPVDFKTP
ncbi:MAG: phosphatase, partial [Gammaproteobacteria bacterium]